MLKNDPPEGERETADQALLRALVHRSSYSSADLRAQSSGNCAREIAIIDRLRKGMVMSDMQAAVWENVVFSHAAALSRWEGEGGSPCGGDQAVTPEKRGI
ncbi:MAG: hypothetical protein ACK4ZJ_05645 [Allorhizobium sp.]|uniref:Uncharacterized protein n=1 Tax=Rhizobium rosettiformans TaxID=1368430 RepID=A0ABX7EUA7_9HYPH|nr:hypothetical protein [Rhizobium rosettiformans]ODS57874.1 MAG: hypothetical protein ABS40_02995 [Agrobacterium sp. SCN 61-19]QRF51929.1 hypothetical protein D4A92_11020 [Rhizobium rosettiformans]